MIPITDGDLIAKMLIPRSRTAYVEIHQQRPGPGVPVWFCSCGGGAAVGSKLGQDYTHHYRKKCVHLTNLWNGLITESIQKSNDDRINPRPLVELSELGGEILRERWAALALSK
jgi:hypothetical protein